MKATSIRLVLALSLFSAIFIVYMSLFLTLNASIFQNYSAYLSLLSFTPDSYENHFCSRYNSSDQCDANTNCTSLMAHQCQFSPPEFIGCYDRDFRNDTHNTSNVPTQCAINQDKGFVWDDDPKEFLPKGWEFDPDCSVCKSQQPNITLITLIWNEIDSFIHSHKTWEQTGFLDLIAEKIVFIQEVTREKSELFENLNYSVIGSAINQNIAFALDSLVYEAKSEYVIFLEKDWAIFENKKKVRFEISAGISLMRDYGVDNVKYRSRRNPGLPSWAHSFKNKEDATVAKQPTMMCNLYRFIEHPDLKWPGRMDKCPKHAGYYCLDSHNCNWTNNPSMFRRQWWIDQLSKYVKEVAKDNKHNWEGFTKAQAVWGDKHHKIALGDGLFTHYEVNEDHYNPQKLPDNWPKKL